MRTPDNREAWILSQARGRPLAERAAFLDGACAGNVDLRRRVDALLAAEPAAATSLGPTVIDPDDPLLPPQWSGDESPDAQIGRYKLLEKIGEGGFGEVYVAEQKEPVKRRVALKIIKLGMDTRQVVARFESERQALAMMDHPNIAKVLDGGVTANGRPYFVMELVKGIPITQHCDQNHLSTEERLRLFTQVCQAIQHAHQKGIIHRDIKPSNILVSVLDGVAVPKVIDFGIAKATQGELTDKTVYTQLQQFIGTPAYMSPEQAEMSAQDIDTRSDIYSLGVLLYELLVGRTPFDAKELLESGVDAMRRTIREKEAPRPSTRLGGMLEEERTTAARRRSAEAQKLVSLLRGDLDWIVMKCLEKDRGRRYETANGLAVDIMRYLTNEPVMARPPSAVYRFQKAFRRNKLAFTAAALLALALVLGTVGTAWQAVRATLAERRAQTEARRALAAERIAKEKSTVAEEQRRKADRSAEDLRENLYASEMSAAFGAFWAGSIQRTRDLLDHQSEPATADQRGFEWRWLWGQTRAVEQSVLTVAKDTVVTAVDFSPDGRRFLTFDLSRLKVWDTVTRELLLSNRQEFGYHAEFSRDGRFIVSVATWDSQPVRLWDATTGVLRTNLAGLSPPVLSATISPDGRWLASTGSKPYGKDDGEICLWDMATMTKVSVLVDPGTQFIFHPRFSPDSRILAAGCGNGHILLWDVATRRVVARLTGHQGCVMGVAFTPDGRRLVSGGLDRTVRLWDLNAAREISLLGLHEKGIYGVAVSPDGSRAATTGYDHMVKIWNLDPPGLFHTFHGHRARVAGVAFHPDGATLATSASDGTVRFWKMPPRPEGWSLDGVYGRSFGFSSKQRLLLGLLADGHVDVWDVAARKRLVHVPGEDAAWLPATEDLVFHRGRQLIELHVPSESEHVLGAAAESEGGLHRIACSSDGRLLAWGHGDHAHVFDRQGRVEIKRLTMGEKRAQQIAFSPDGAILAAAGDGPDSEQPGVIQLWDWASGRLTKTLAGHQMGIKAVRFSPDGQQLASSSTDRSTRLWRLSTGEASLLQDDEGEPPSLAFSPDGRTLAVGTYEGSVKLWNVATRHQIASLAAGSSIVQSVDFSPDGSALGSITLDGKVRVWQAPLWAEIQAVGAAESVP